MGTMSAYMYWDAEESFDVEVYDGVTYVSPKYTEDNNNYAGKLFNVQGEGLVEAAFDANATIDVVTARFDWNSIAAGQTLVVKDYEVDVPGENPVDVENGELVVNIYSNNGSVYVETEADAMIEVYTVNGLRVFAGVSNTNTTVINGLTDIAIIRVNGVAYKVFVK
jgi:glutamine cyclotransferase